ncbi:MAG TPA: FHA domain-containing protein [Kamptonema sp.]|nr:FHA domain-containing protein [Kamptonema sp.]
MIKLTLLHPLQSIPVRSWAFEDELVVRIGRSTDNHVVLYSAVVSRRHVELRRTGVDWEVINLGTNGTYLDGKPITQVPVVDGLIIHLARSGPKIQIHLEKQEPKPHSGRVTVKPRDTRAINDVEAIAQIATISVSDNPRVPSKKDEEELTETDCKRDKSQ